MRYLITGPRGQLGQALMELHPEAHGVGRQELDITQLEAVQETVNRIKPDCIIHCAAWTQVDEAVRQPQAAFNVNALATYFLAQAAAQHRAKFVYLSTNEVFDGTKTTPYLEDDSPNPVNPYGFSKWAGERIVRTLLPQSWIVRTSWLTGRGGKKNFVHRIQQLAEDQGNLQVVTDEVACPTFVADLAPAIFNLIETGSFGTYHLVNEGYCSRYVFARLILDLSGRKHIPIEPITQAEYPRTSTPPLFSPLANVQGAHLGIKLPPWEESLAQFLS